MSVERLAAKKYVADPPYGYRICPLCEGRGVNPAYVRDVCPKCQGERYMPLKGWRR